MKYKKRSLKKKQRQRQHFSKKYAAATVQRGGGFMETIAEELIAMEGRTHTCMAVHPTEPLVAVGDDSGIVTLWDLGKAPPKKLAQLIGLQSAVKCVEFNKTFPLVAGACNDIVLMWRFDQISREQQDQQVQPSHMVSDFRMRNETKVEQELSETKIILEEAEKERRAITYDQVIIRNNLRDIEKKMTAINEDNRFRKGALFLQERAFDLNRMLKKAEDFNKEEKSNLFNSRGLMNYESIRKLRELKEEVEKQLEPLRQELEELQAQKKTMTERFNELETRLESITTLDNEIKIRQLDRELKLIRTGARNEVSCIAFRPGSVNRNTMSYIAVGVNNDKNKTDNRIIIYRFEIESSSVENLYSFRTILEGEPKEAHPDVSLMSFSHNGALFAFVTKSSDGGTVLKVINFKGSSGYYFYEFRVYKIDQHATSIMSYKSYYSGRGEDQHQFIIGCDNGSLLMTQATTVSTQGFSVTKVTDLKNIREWNAGEPVNCVAVHPSLPLFASGTRGVTKLWDIDQREPLESLALQDVISVGFNQDFLAARGPRSIHFYSCKSDDYGSFKEKYKIKMQEKIERKERLDKLHNELREKTLKGQCAICLGSMTGQTQPSITSGPEEIVEKYLPCKHKFHKKCIEQWLKQGNTCPECRAKDGLPQSTPANVVKKRSEELAQLEKKFNESDEINREARRALFAAAPASPASPEAVAPETVAPELTQEELRAARLAYFSQQQQQQQPSENSGGNKRNKYSRKKYSSKKSKIRRRYSKKYKY